ncbi:MAG: NUDIX hydrolase [Dehalococcoidia bacterium]
MGKFEKINHCVSAGGVVYRFNSENLQVLICGRDNSNLWALPKGTPEVGENIIDTALREVNEETGIKTVFENLIGSIGYNFSDFKFNVINQKIVFYYLMIAVGGDVSNHDDEFDRVVWINYEEAKKILTYKDEVLILAKGISMVQERRPRSY